MLGRLCSHTRSFIAGGKTGNIATLEDSLEVSYKSKPPLPPASANVCLCIFPSDLKTYAGMLICNCYNLKAAKVSLNI